LIVIDIEKKRVGTGEDIGRSGPAFGWVEGQTAVPAEYSPVGGFGNKEDVLFEVD
jgi:hypothetical protein